MNIMPIKAELMSMHLGLIPAMDNKDTCTITVITDSPNPLQRIILPIASKMMAFLNRSSQNTIQFWQCPKKTEWSQHKLVNNQVKAFNGTPTCPSKNLYLFSRKKKCGSTLKEW